MIVKLDYSTTWPQEAGTALGNQVYRLMSKENDLCISVSKSIIQLGPRTTLGAATSRKMQ
jgi:hypothetical protein